jgi:hypothetical protein
MLHPLMMTIPLRVAPTARTVQSRYEQPTKTFSDYTQNAIGIKEPTERL